MKPNILFSNPKKDTFFKKKKKKKERKEVKVNCSDPHKKTEHVNRNLARNLRFIPFLWKINGNLRKVFPLSPISYLFLFYFLSKQTETIKKINPKKRK